MASSEAGTPCIYFVQSIYVYIPSCKFSPDSLFPNTLPFPTETHLNMYSVRLDAAVAAASSEAGRLPNATSLTNTNFKCGDTLEGSGGAGGDDSTSSSYSPCSGSVCLDGDVGVYCQCYYPTRSPSSEVTHHLAPFTNVIIDPPPQQL